MATPSFTTTNLSTGAGPVLLSVPHAGRCYQSALIEQLRVPLAAVMSLEDRYADCLADDARASGFPVITALTPRLAIDLNRGPDDLDRSMILGGTQNGTPSSAKARAGLGLIPTRLWGVGPLWRDPVDRDTIASRLRDIHLPYHHAVSRALIGAQQHWGSAMLIDLHSMPPIAGNDAPDIVIGDCFGKSCTARLTAIAETLFSAAGLRVAVNVPYAGGYIASRHGRPDSHFYALQIEVDRRLYLDDALDEPAAGLARMQRLILMLAETFRDELMPRVAAAAE